MHSWTHACAIKSYYRKFLENLNIVRKFSTNNTLNKNTGQESVQNTFKCEIVIFRKGCAMRTNKHQPSSVFLKKGKICFLLFPRKGKKCGWAEKKISQINFAKV